MRWIKHLTATTQDEKIAAYLDDCGPSHRHEGYGFFWLLLEVVAAQIENGSDKCSATYALPTWSRLLYCHHHTVGKYMGKLGVAGLVTVRKGESKIEVIIPNLLKYRDEYSRKSGHSQENVGSKKQIQNTDTDGEADKPLSPTDVGGGSELPFTLFPVEPKYGKSWFDARFKLFWANCHNKTGKLKARAAFEKKVLELVRKGATHEVAAQFLTERMGAEKPRFQGSEEWDSRSKMHPTTWLNGERWDDQDPKAREPPSKKQSFADQVTQQMQERLERGEAPW